MGIGFNSTMINCDMHAINAYSDGKVDVLDLYSFRRTVPAKDDNLGGINDIKEIQVEDLGNFVMVSYSRKISTGDKYDADLNFNTPIPFNVAWMDGDMENNYHASNYFITQIIINTNGSSTNGSTSSVDVFWKIHGIGHLICWSVLVFIGYESARFLKHHPNWLVYHFIGGTIPSFFSIFVIVMAIVKKKSGSDTSAINSLHNIGGLIFGGILIFHITLGYIGYFGIYKSSGINSNAYFKLKIIHKFIGIFLTYFSHLFTISGFLILFPSLYVIPLTLCCILFLLLITLELIYYKINQNKPKLISKAFYEIDNENLEIISIKRLRDEKAKKSFVIYENLLLDVTKYAKTHPGGNNLLMDNLYQDVSRYLTGNQAYSSEVSQYDHNIQTCTFAIKSLAYAKIEDHHKIILKNGKTEYINNDTRFENKITICDSINQINFSFIGGYKFPIFIPGISWLGRHFAISSIELNKTRYYSICLCLNKTIQDRINQLLKNITLLEKKKVIKIPVLEENLLLSETLSFYIKNYHLPNGLSSYLSYLEEFSSSKLIIRGPIGIGLGLPERLNGFHILIAGGTGVIPYLDFCFYIIRYIVDRISRTFFKEKDNRIDLNESFYEIDNDFKLILLFSYSSQKYMLMDEIFNTVLTLDKKYSLNQFEYYVRTSNNKMWDEIFFSKILNGGFKKSTRVNICGPVGFMEKIKKAIQDTEKVDDKNIFFT